MAKPLFQLGIVKQLAQKYKLDESVVEDAVYFQFKFVKQTIEKGEFESVRLPFFGKFHANPNRIKHLKEIDRERLK